MSTDVAWPALPEGTTWETVRVSPVWVLARMPDGSCWPGAGPTTGDAVADARRWWQWWKRGHPAKLAACGRDYQRRLRSRRRRR